MAKAYVVAHLKMKHSSPDINEYREKVPKTLQAFGGKFLVRGGESYQLEGTSTGDRHIIAEFPSVEKAKAWYESEEYQAIIHLRINNMISNVVIVEGV